MTNGNRLETAEEIRKRKRIEQMERIGRPVAVLREKIGRARERARARGAEKAELRRIEREAYEKAYAEEKGKVLAVKARERAIRRAEAPTITERVRGVIPKKRPRERAPTEKPRKRIGLAGVAQKLVEFDKRLEKKLGKGKGLGLGGMDFGLGLGKGIDFGLGKMDLGLGGLGFGKPKPRKVKRKKRKKRASKKRKRR